MRFLLAAVTLATTFALGQAVALADEPLAVAAPAAPHDTPFSIQGYGAALVADGAIGMAGVQMGMRLSHSFELELDYARVGDGSDTIGLLGAGLHWLAVSGNVTTYLYAGIAAPTVGVEPIVEFPVFRGGIGGEWTAQNGVFVSAQLGADVLAFESNAYPVVETRVGVGVRF